MDELLQQMEQLESRENLSASIASVQRAIDLLTAARAKVAEAPKSAPQALAELQKPFKDTLDKAQNDLKPVYKGLAKYGKALDKKFKNQTALGTDGKVLARPELIDRAIGYHFLREGDFDIFNTFVGEATPRPSTPQAIKGLQDYALSVPEGLEHDFEDLYQILKDLRERHSLDSAIEWARENAVVLEKRGSNLEFELCEQRFKQLFNASIQQAADYMGDGDPPTPNPTEAIRYGRNTFPRFRMRYSAEIERLAAALAYASNIQDSPYHADFKRESAWDDIATSFSREFCSLLGLSADSPLYLAVNAGAIALPIIMKLQQRIKERNAEWTTEHELPVTVPLHAQFQFHSIFICPVLKVQTTDDNPPMRLVCGHVICEQALLSLSKNSRIKCPYCPREGSKEDALKIVL